MTALPLGFRIRPDAALRRYDDDRLLLGGNPRRLLRLSDDGARAATRLLDGARVAGVVDAVVARRLVSAGLAHSVPPSSTVARLHVVVPAYDDAASLLRSLRALASDLPVTVVDDGSRDADRVADVARQHGARLLRLPVNRGPAAARNAGAAAATDADVIAFVDSDAVVSPETLTHVAAHFADPCVAAVAPRVRPQPCSGDVLRAVAKARSPLDMQQHAGLVRPSTRIAFVPSTVLLVRRSALDAIGGFDDSLRQGEDVDLVWRLVAAGHDVRYEPLASAHHAEPSSWSGWLRRRFAYGTSAAPLAARHGAPTVSLRLRPAPAVALALTIVGQRRLAGVVAVATAARVVRRVGEAGVPARNIAVDAIAAPAHSAMAAGRWTTQLWWPALLVAMTARHTRTVAATAAIAPALAEWWQRRPDVDPLRWTLAVWADDIAYGAGVWRGAIRARDAGPLLPTLRRH